MRKNLNMKIDVRNKKVGQVFTPLKLVTLILDNVEYDGLHMLGKKILEPSFGNGAFLEEIVKRILQYSSIKELKNNLLCVYGWEIDKSLYDETLTKLNKLIKPYNIAIDWNIECVNSIYKMSYFRNLVKQKYEKFDYIVGNPPYVIKRNLDKETQNFIASNYSYCNGSYDLYYAFFELSLKFLNTNGKIAFITPSTYFYNFSAAKLRKSIISKKNISKIIDFKRHLVFKDIWTFTCVSFFTKGNTKNHLEYYQANDSDPYVLNKKKIAYKDLSENSWVFDDEKKMIGKPLDNVVKIYQALNTQRDRIFIIRINSEIDNKYVNVSSRFEENFKIEKAILKPAIKISKQICIDGKLKEYLIFPYMKNGANYKTIDESNFKKDYPCAYAYLFKYKSFLEKRPFKKWYAANDSFFKLFERTIGEKIVFSYVMNGSNKFHYRNDSEIYYSGFIIKLKNKFDSYGSLLKKLNSQETWDYFKNRFAIIKTGWSRVNLNTVKTLLI